MKKIKTPAIFVGHGSPMSALNGNFYNKVWIDLGKTLKKPKAILVISAHWNIDKTAVSDVLKPHQIFDFYGFPEQLYNLKYEAAGSPELANKIIKLLKPLTKVEIDNEWGIDHGAWVPLNSFFPKADIPVVQLSIDYNKSADFHYQIGKALRPLREQDVLIIGSGDIVHNLQEIKYEENSEPFYWANDFEEKILTFIKLRDHQSLINYLNISPEAKLSIPTPEHYLPLLYTLALQEEDDSLNCFINSIAHGSISMTSFIIN